MSTPTEQSDHDEVNVYADAQPRRQSLTVTADDLVIMTDVRDAGGVRGAFDAEGDAIAAAAASAATVHARALQNPTFGVQANAHVAVTDTMLAQHERQQEEQPRQQTMYTLLQAACGTVDVTVTLHPMQARTLLQHVPVQRSHAASVDDLDSADVTGWVLSARTLFERVAQHLCVHPRRLVVWHHNARVRFNAALHLDCDTSHTDAVANAPLTRRLTRAEAVWVTVGFVDISSSSSSNSNRKKDTGTVHDDCNSCSRHTDNAGTSNNDNNDDDDDDDRVALATTTQTLPPHLSTLAAGEVLARCVLVRRVRPELDPADVLAHCSAGRTCDEVIQELLLQQPPRDAVAAAAASGDAHTDDTAAAAVVVPVAMVHDGDVRHVFLGGYRDTRQPTRVLLHAATQLFADDPSLYSPFAAHTASMASVARCSRQTQTLGTSRSCQTRRECCVQTPRRDLATRTHAVAADDGAAASAAAAVNADAAAVAAAVVVVTARPYFSAAALRALRTRHAIVLQKLYRAWKARQIRRQLEDAEAARQRCAALRQRTEEAAQLARYAHTQQRRADPRTARDFAQRRREVAAWSAAEVAKVRASYARRCEGDDDEDKSNNNNTSSSSAAASAAEERRRALLAITRQELRMLQSLEQRQRLAAREAQSRQFASTMRDAAAARVWGGGVQVHTPATVRAGELWQLYCALVSSATAHKTNSGDNSHHAYDGGVDGSIDKDSDGSHNNNYKNVATTAVVDGNEGGTHTQATGRAAAAAMAPLPLHTRLDVLLHVKWTVKEFDGCELVRELCQLIDREADLLQRGRSVSVLSGLRQRTAYLFRRFVEDPQYNPGMAAYTRSAADKAKATQRRQEEEEQAEGSRLVTRRTTTRHMYGTNVADV